MNAKLFAIAIFSMIGLFSIGCDAPSESVTPEIRTIPLVEDTLLLDEQLELVLTPQDIDLASYRVFIDSVELSSVMVNGNNLRVELTDSSASGMVRVFLDDSLIGIGETRLVIIRLRKADLFSHPTSLNLIEDAGYIGDTIWLQTNAPQIDRILRFTINDLDLEYFRANGLACFIVAKNMLSGVIRAYVYDSLYGSAQFTVLDSPVTILPGGTLSEIRLGMRDLHGATLHNKISWDGEVERLSSGDTINLYPKIQRVPAFTVARSASSVDCEINEILDERTWRLSIHLSKSQGDAWSGYVTASSMYRQGQWDAHGHSFHVRLQNAKLSTKGKAYVFKAGGNTLSDVFSEITSESRASDAGPYSLQYLVQDQAKDQFPSSYVELVLVP